MCSSGSFKRSDFWCSCVLKKSIKMQVQVQVPRLSKPLGCPVPQSLHNKPLIFRWHWSFQKLYKVRVFLAAEISLGQDSQMGNFKFWSTSMLRIVVGDSGWPWMVLKCFGKVVALGDALREVYVIPNHNLHLRCKWGLNTLRELFKNYLQGSLRKDTPEQVKMFWSILK